MSGAQPYGPRIAVMDAPADEPRSGLIIPAEYARLRKGVVVGVGEDVPLLSVGCVVWYTDDCVLEVGDLKFVDQRCVIAWEA